MMLLRMFGLCSGVLAVAGSVGGHHGGIGLGHLAMSNHTETMYANNTTNATTNPPPIPRMTTMLQLMDATTTIPSLGGDAHAVHDLGVTSMLALSGLVGIAMCVSISFQLALLSRIVIAALRCVIQLTALGYVLVPVFRNNTWYVVLGYACVMLLVASAEAAGRPSYSYKGMLFNTLLALGAGATATLAYALVLVLDFQPWYDARYIIPLVGMLLGSAVSGVSVGLTTVTEELSLGRERIEVLLAMGATRLEATRPALRRAMMVALQPMLNQMAVVGIVSIPGMMTGQILSGSDPSIAARYQMMIMFLISACTAIAATAAVMGVLLTVVDADHFLHADKLVARGGRGKGITGAIGNAVGSVAQVVERWMMWAFRPLVCKFVCKAEGACYVPIPAGGEGGVDEQGTASTSGQCAGK